MTIVSSPATIGKTGIIPEFEGLRGLLALWVVFGHWSTTVILPFQPMRQDLWRVSVFIILSGFVIAMLLDRTPVTYGRYIVRRWFRIAPAYLVVLAAAAVFLPMIQDVLTSAPEREMKQVRLDMIADTQQNYVSNLLLHAFMVHGMVPESWVPHAAYAFIGQAWSLSLEWQFYLVAPLFYALIQRIKSRKGIVELGLLMAAIIIPAAYLGRAYIGNQWILFVTGALSYFIWKRISENRWQVGLRQIRWAGLAIVVLAVALRGDQLMGIALWTIAFTVIVAGRLRQAGLEGKLCAILNSRPCQFLGRISYTLYLVHFMVMVLGMALIRNLELSPNAYAAALLGFTMPAAILMAWLVSLSVERPGMQLGKRLTQKALPVQPSGAVA